MPAYGSLSAQFYDIDKPEPLADAYAFYLEHALRAAGPVLEPMCGSGRFLLPMLAAGVDIEGVDTSAQMLSACRTRAHSLGLKPTLHECSLSKLAATRSFDLAFIPNGSFCLLTDQAEIESSLQRLLELLRPGGTLLLELERLRPQPPESSGTWGGRWVNCPDGSKIVLSWLGQYSGRADVTASLHRYERVVEGRLVDTEFEDFDVKSYTWEEAHALLSRCGFVSVKAYKPYADAPPDEHDEAWIFSARRAD
jgi:SAM-dependent methyltransferase